MNLSFTDLFNSNSGSQDSDSIDRSSEEDESDDYKRDAADEHYLSEYRDRNSEPAKHHAEKPHEDEEKNDRFSHKGHFYDQTNHDRFNHSSGNSKS